jgi:diguanylate cyclase (GGDEF)-like protein
MPATDTDGAQVVAERVRQAVADLSEPHAGADMGIVTISVGLTAAVATAGLPDQLIKIADQALYEAKRDGRNRVATGQ